MGLPRGKGKFYKKCRLDDLTKQIIRYYNKNLAAWKSGKKIYLTKEGE